MSDTVTVFVAGSTGVLGRRLVGRLADRGHDVIGLVRDDADVELVRRLDGEPRRGDVLERDSLLEAVDETVDVVIHAATAIPTGGKPSADDWARNDRIRLEGTRNLLAAAEAADAGRFLLQSIVWVARQPDGRPFDERSEPHPDRTTRSALEAERLLETSAGELETCTLRCGWFYSHDSAQTRRFGEQLLDRKLPVLGGGLLGRRDATLSVLHADDAASAFVAATEGEGSATGTYHVVDDRTTLAAFVRTLAEQLSAPEPRRLPGWLVRPLVGRDTVRFLTSSMPTTNERFRDAFDWEPTLSTYRVGLDRVVDRWLEDGTVRELPDGGLEWVGDRNPRQTWIEGRESARSPAVDR